MVDIFGLIKVGLFTMRKNLLVTFYCNKYIPRSHCGSGEFFTMLNGDWDMKHVAGKLIIICASLLVSGFLLLGCSDMKNDYVMPGTADIENMPVLTDEAMIAEKESTSKNAVADKENTIEGAATEASAELSDRERYLRTIVEAANSEEMLAAIDDGYDAVCEYSFFDFTKDGVNDLIIKSGTCEADFMYYFYTLIDGKPVKVGEYGGGHSILASDGRDLIVDMGIQGYEEAHRIIYSDGKIGTEEMFNRYVGMRNYYEFPMYLVAFDAKGLPTPDCTAMSQTFVGNTGFGNLYCGNFTVNLPESWADKYVCEFIEWDVSYEMHFYESDSYDYGEGGELFSLLLIPEDSGYDENSPGCVSAMTSSYDNGMGGIGTYTEYLIVDYPAVQSYMPESAEKYLAMQRDIPSILENISYADGVEVSVVLK